MKKKLIAVAVMVGILALILSVYAWKSTDQAESSQLRPADKRYKKIVERDIIYDFKIPSAEEIEQIKAEKRQASEYKSEVEKLGKEQAEKDIDAKIQKAVDYRNEMNKKGKGKIQLAEIGSHSAWLTLWTYDVDGAGGCTVNAEDPMNLFFGGNGSFANVTYRLMYANPQWTSAAGGDSCAWTGTSDPGVLYVSDLRKQATQLQDGSFANRHHLRIWWAPDDPDPNGWHQWSVGSTHHEWLCWYCYPPDHCVDDYDGSEGHVVNSVGVLFHTGKHQMAQLILINAA